MGISVNIWSGVDAYYAYYTDIRMRRKLYKMDQDLCRDSIRQVQRITFMKDEYIKYVSYISILIILIVSIGRIKLHFVVSKITTHFPWVTIKKGVTSFYL